MVKGTNMKKLLLLIYLTPETLSNHKKLCSIKFKNEERLFCENFFKFCLKDCILRSHHFSAEGTFKHFFGFKLEHFFYNIALTCKKPCNVTVKCTYLKSVLLFQVQSIFVISMNNEWKFFALSNASYKGVKIIQ